eukprot:332961-Prorocentrum_minimum.AAC.2
MVRLAEAEGHPPRVFGGVPQRVVRRRDCVRTCPKVSESVKCQKCPQMARRAAELPTRGLKTSRAEILKFRINFPTLKRKYRFRTGLDAD